MLPATDATDVLRKRDLAAFEERLVGRFEHLEGHLGASFRRSERRVITCNVICIIVGTVAAAVIARFN